MKFEQTTVIEDVFDVIRDLPSAFREPFLLRADGLSFDEIGERIGYTGVSARRNIIKARFLIERRLLKLNPKRYGNLLK